MQTALGLSPAASSAALKLASSVTPQFPSEQGSPAASQVSVHDAPAAPSSQEGFEDEPAVLTYRQLPLELLAPLVDRHVSHVPVPSQLPSEMDRQAASATQAARASASVLWVAMAFAPLQ